MQVIDEGMGSTFIKMKLKDQERSMQLLAHDPQLSKLTRLEVRSAACCTCLAWSGVIAGGYAIGNMQSPTPLHHRTWSGWQPHVSISGT